MKIIRVVVVDDQDIIRRGVTAMIDHESDMDVVGIASTGEEALELVAGLDPDVAIVDDSLPGMGGVEVCIALSADHPNTAILVLAAHPEDGLARRFVEAGARGYLAKDVDAWSLGQAVRAVAKGEAALDLKLTARLLCWADKQAARSASSGLTLRELEVLRLVARGATNKVVANELHLSENTVKTYVQRALGKLNSRSRTQAATVAARRGLL